MSSDGLKEALEKLKDSGVRMTPQRHAILAYLFKSKSHPTADEIYRALEKDFPNMSVATVYNNLKVFLEVGLIEELLFGDDSSRFEVKHEEHYHVVCRKCGHIEDFISPCLSDMESLAEKEKGFIIDGHRVEFYGICSKCQQEAKLD
ncbi:Fur family transcriptional regulator [Vulcanibacillus modesticaldus]|nr:Fur family transcriptional regulator [Vulcanibacillus modesticaldus]